MTNSWPLSFPPTDDTLLVLDWTKYMLWVDLYRALSTAQPDQRSTNNKISKARLCKASPRSLYRFHHHKYLSSHLIIYPVHLKACNLLSTHSVKHVAIVQSASDARTGIRSVRTREGSRMSVDRLASTSCSSNECRGSATVWCPASPGRTLGG
jgi:hypothetical protein